MPLNHTDILCISNAVLPGLVRHCALAIFSTTGTWVVKLVWQCQSAIPVRRIPQLCWAWAELVLTHWGRGKMAAVSQTMFSNAFSWMKMYEFRLKFHWIMFLMFQLTIFQHWFRYWLGAVQATSHYLNQCWLVYWRIYASLGLNDLTTKCTLQMETQHDRLVLLAMDAVKLFCHEQLDGVCDQLRTIPYKVSQPIIYCIIVSHLPLPCSGVMMTSSNGNIFRVICPLYGHRWIPLTNANDAFSLICTAWRNGWINHRDGALRRNRVHYDVTVMVIWWHHWTLLTGSGGLNVNVDCYWPHDTSENWCQAIT